MKNTGKPETNSLNTKKSLVFVLPAIVALLGVSVFTTTFQTQESLPQIQDKSTVTGWVTLTVYDEFGNVKQKVENHNLVVDQGLDEMAEAIFGVGGVGTTLFDYLEIGTSATAPSAGQTALVASACARVQDASPDVNSAISGETSVSVISSFVGATCAGGIQEAGIFNGLAGGQMLARSTFGVVTIGSGDTLNVNYTVTLT